MRFYNRQHRHSRGIDQASPCSQVPLEGKLMGTDGAGRGRRERTLTKRTMSGRMGWSAKGLWDISLTISRPWQIVKGRSPRQARAPTRAGRRACGGSACVARAARLASGESGRGAHGHFLGRRRPVGGDVRSASSSDLSNVSRTARSLGRRAARLLLIMSESDAT